MLEGKGSEENLRDGKMDERIAEICDDLFKDGSIENKPVKELSKKLAEDEIIDRLGIDVICGRDGVS